MSTAVLPDEATRVARLVVERMRKTDSADMAAAFLHVCATNRVALPGLAQKGEK